jgi:ribosome-binding factor A
MAKTGYSRADRVADQIRMEVADILMRKIKDPRVRAVTVTDVELTNDLRIARVFVTVMFLRG